MKKLLWLWRSCAVGGLLGLIALILLWNGWLTPVQQFPRSLELLILLAPLLWLLRGILQGRNSSHVYAILVSLLYATLGAWYAFTPQEEPYGWLMIVLSAILYVGGFMSAKVTGEKPTDQKK